MTEPLSDALERQAQAPEAKTVFDLIDRMTPELEKSLHSREMVDALKRHYATALRLDPTLLQCTGESLLAALLLSAQVRLEPGPLGHVYIVPFKVKGVHECVWILGYTGILELARRSERVAACKARVVWDNDEYEYWEDEKGEHFKFRPGDEQARTERRLVVVTWKERAGGSWVARALEVPRSRIERAQKASPAFRAKSGPWVTDETAMWAKTGVRAVRPWLPLSPEFAQASAADEAVMQGVEVDAAGAAQASLEARERPE